MVSFRNPYVCALNKTVVESLKNFEVLIESGPGEILVTAAMEEASHNNDTAKVDFIIDYSDDDDNDKNNKNENCVKTFIMVKLMRVK